jgi:hypothetical protein
VVTVLSLLALGVAMLLVVVTAQAAVGAARAQAAADASALGAIGGDEARAADLARRNGARLVAFVTRGPCVEVLVAVGRSQARARATIAGVEGGYPCDEEASRRLDVRAHR